MLTLEAPSRQAGQLACPQCGAGVAPTSAACTYCSAELLLKGCPRCLSRVFHGHKHCPECGTQLDLAANGDTHAERPCPRCRSALRPRLVGDLLIDECAQCLGLFLDQVAIQRVITDRQQARAESLLGALPRAGTTPIPPPEKLYVKCPCCHTIMNRRQFATGAGIIVDVCKHHGTFFDHGELPRIIEFVMNGGLEKAAQADLARVRDAARRDQQAAASAQMMAAARIPDRSSAPGTALIDLLFSLWS
jgi:Zn-finger nucleic acid-binding protein